VTTWNLDLLSLLETAPARVPGESDIEACRRLFRGQKYKCKLCDDEIEWIGVCGHCDFDIRRGRWLP
jgi:hypothetical protein